MPVYFTRIGDADGPIKIGYSIHPIERLKGLTGKFKRDATLLGVMQEDREFELHQKFEHCRVMMEFELFHPTTELLDFIQPYLLPKPITKPYLTKAESRLLERSRKQDGHGKFVRKPKVARKRRKA